MTSKLSYINSKLCQYENTYGTLSIMTDGTQLYLCTDADKQDIRVAFPLEAKTALNNILNSLRPADTIAMDEESLEYLRAIRAMAKTTLAPYLQPGDERLVDLMFFTPLVYEAQPPREPKHLKYRLWYRDGGEADSPAVILEEGEADEIYVNRKALTLKRGINRPLHISIFDAKSGEYKKVADVITSRFYDDANRTGKWLNLDGITFTPDKYCH